MIYRPDVYNLGVLPPDGNRVYGVVSLLGDVVKFYQVQLHRYPEAVVYLDQHGLRQPELIEQLRIG